jgi:hypothetical protein
MFSLVPPIDAVIFTDYPGSFTILGEVNATEGDGFYAHIAMYSGVAGQITEFVPPRRIFSNIWNFFKKLATAYGMINVSDLKRERALHRLKWVTVTQYSDGPFPPLQRCRSLRKQSTATCGTPTLSTRALAVEVAQS